MKNDNITRYIYYMLFIFHFSFFSFQLSAPAYSQQDPLTIAIIQPQDITAYYEAVDGFLKHLGRHLKPDFNTIVYESPQGLYARLEQEKKNLINSSDIDLILTVRTEATSEVSHKISDIPIVFTMVLDPERILNYRSNIVGASVNIPSEVQLNMIKEILPSVENVGVIYDPNRNSNFVEQSTVLAEKLGLRIKPFPVKSQKDIPKTLQQLRKEAEVLWGIVDNTVYTSQTAKYIIEYTQKERLPFIGISTSWVKAGALWALMFDNEDIGRQSADLARRLLSGTPVSDLQTTTPERIHLAINLRTADIIGIEIPKKIREQASIIYE